MLFDSLLLDTILHFVPANGRNLYTVYTYHRMSVEPVSDVFQIQTTLFVSAEYKQEPFVFQDTPHITPLETLSVPQLVSIKTNQLTCVP